MEHASFNHTAHLLSVTTKLKDLDQTREYLRSNPIINSATVSSNAF